MTNLLRRCYLMVRCIHISSIHVQAQTVMARNWRCSILHQSFSTTLRYMGGSKPKYPPINETELEEKFTRGGGPGGQATNTTSNCVLLKHIPTGLVIKCHAERSLEMNRKIARRRMQERIDDYYNGEDSIKAKEKRRAKAKLLSKKAKTKKKLEKLALERAAADSTIVDNSTETADTTETVDTTGITVDTTSAIVDTTSSTVDKTSATVDITSTIVGATSITVDATSTTVEATSDTVLHGVATHSNKMTDICSETDNSTNGSSDKTTDTSNKPVNT